MKIYPVLLLIVGCSIASGVIGSKVSELETDIPEEKTASVDAITGTSTDSNTVEQGPIPENSSAETGSEISAYTSPTAEDAPIAGNQKPVTVTQDIDIERSTDYPGSESIVDDNKNVKSLNDDNDATTAQSNTSDDPSTPANHMASTNAQADDTERIPESISGVPENDEQEEGKNIDDDKNKASKNIDSKDGVAPPQANYNGNNTHITITQTIDIGGNGGSINGESRNDENEENRKPVTITQDIEVDKTTKENKNENSPNDANERSSEHTDTADAAVPLPANHTHITITQAIELGGNSGNNENEEGKNVNDDKHAQTPHSQEHITLTQDIDIERITESALSESTGDGNTNENSTADMHHPANHTHVAITNVVNIEHNSESSSDANDEADAQIPEERKHITLTQDIDIVRTTKSIDDDENDEDSQHTNTNDIDTHHTANHTHITVTQVIDIERIKENTSDASDVEVQTANDDNCDPDAQSSAKPNHITITQVIEVDRITENDDSDEFVIDENNKESASNGEKTSANVDTADAHTPANHTHVTVKQEFDIGGPAADINGESEKARSKKETVPIEGENDECSEPIPTDEEIINALYSGPAIPGGGCNGTGSDESATIANNAETNTDVKCKPCPAKTKTCSPWHCKMLLNLIEGNEEFNQYIQRILDNIEKLSTKRAKCNCNKIEHKS